MSGVEIAMNILEKLNNNQSVDKWDVYNYREEIMGLMKEDDDVIDEVWHEFFLQVDLVSNPN